VACRRRINRLNHAIRLRHLLRLTLAEFGEASGAFVDHVLEAEADTASTHEELLERGAPVAVRVHLRAEAFLGLARLLLARLGDELPALDLDRDFHVRLSDERREFTATLWAESGDAEIAPGTRADSVRLDELLKRLEARVDTVRADVS
jgi:hypothetical protein